MGIISAADRQAMIFNTPGPLIFAELDNLQNTEAMSLAFREDFKGDRVFALMVGLTGMIRKSYDYNEELFIPEDLDAQMIYDSARNIETMAWKLKNKLDARGNYFVISFSDDGTIDNLSFERIYGKLIATQDLMAMVIADKDNRAINTVVHGVMSVFIPI